VWVALVRPSPWKKKIVTYIYLQDRIAFAERHIGTLIALGKGDWTMEYGSHNSLNGSKLWLDSKLSALVPSQVILGIQNTEGQTTKRTSSQGLFLLSILKNSNALLCLVKNCPEGFTFNTKLFTEPSFGLVVCLPFCPCGIIFSQRVGDLQDTVLCLQVC